MAYRVRNTIFAIAIGFGGLAVMTADASAQSHRRCDAYARDYANRATRTGNNVVGGAVGGAVVGGVIGSVTGSWGKGAAIGSGVGAIAGAGKSSSDWNRNYRYAYDDCMRGARRGPPPARQGGGRFEPWSPAWHDYCSRKYRSFNPRTGYYTTYGGEQRFCR
ncbi:outer membrane protein with glycine zipper [Breoghania corrubedonensis]|uniref:Lectin-like protein BA14k n=1 Tax=Breoghania corrubedonensis TaxID=665038 RepID=A0A2T5V4R5_9HYPH|nr:BA14K family protein [Breoghania corrubedonensis]PTW58736.1 outer membrane protein with glycine zipper [Breoghania corrubedonensis]